MSGLLNDYSEQISEETKQILIEEGIEHAGAHLLLVMHLVGDTEKLKGEYEDHEGQRYILEFKKAESC